MIKVRDRRSTMCQLEERILKRIAQLERKFMATQAEVAAEMRDMKTQLKKVRAENKAHADKLDEQIKKLEAVIQAGNAGEATAELVAIKDELKAELNDFDTDRPDDEPPAPATA